MAKRENAASRMNLRTDILDDLFGLSEENNDTETTKEDSYVNLNRLVTFKNHPFTVAHDESMDSLVESIREHGLIHPLAVRKISDDEYEILSGHRRKMACEIIGMEKVPVKVFEMDDDAAVIFMTDANFHQRKHISIPDKVKAFDQRYDALRHRGSKGDSTYEALGNLSGDSVATVKRLLQMRKLNEKLLILAEEGRFGILQGAALSALNEKEQEWLIEALMENNVKITQDMANQLRDLSAVGELTAIKLSSVLLVKKKNERNVTFKEKIIREYFNDEYTIEMIEETIIGLLRKWKEEENG